MAAFVDAIHIVIPDFTVDVRVLEGLIASVVNGPDIPFRFNCVFYYNDEVMYTCVVTVNGILRSQSSF